MINNRIHNIESIVLILCGIFLPLITLRLELFQLSISMFMFLLGILILLNIRNVINNVVLLKSDVLILMLLIVMLASSLYSMNIEYALTYWLKLLIVIIIFFFLRTLFTLKPNYISTIMKYAGYSLAIYLMYLGYIYIFEFNETFIGIETNYPTKAGKNSLAFVVALIIPFVISRIANFSKGDSGYIRFNIIVVLILTGSILIQSRALFILILIYILLTIINTKFNLKFIFTISIYFVVSLITFILFLPENISRDLTTRISSILFLFNENYIIQGDSSVAGVSSLETRTNLIDKGISMFLESPIIGNGLGSFRFYEGEASPVSHNDYIQIISEQGIVGLIIFLAIICSYLLKALLVFKKNHYLLWLLLAMIGLTVYLFMINAYDNIFLWFLFSVIEAYRINKDKNNLQKNVIS